MRQQRVPVPAVPERVPAEVPSERVPRRAVLPGAGAAPPGEAMAAPGAAVPSAHDPFPRERTGAVPSDPAAGRVRGDAGRPAEVPAGPAVRRVAPSAAVPHPPAGAGVPAGTGARQVACSARPHPPARVARTGSSHPRPGLPRPARVRAAGPSAAVRPVDAEFPPAASAVPRGPAPAAGRCRGPAPCAAVGGPAASRAGASPAVPHPRRGLHRRRRVAAGTERAAPLPGPAAEAVVRRTVRRSSWPEAGPWPANRADRRPGSPPDQGGRRAAQRTGRTDLRVVQRDARLRERPLRSAPGRPPGPWPGSRRARVRGCPAPGTRAPGPLAPRGGRRSRGDHRSSSGRPSCSGCRGGRTRPCRASRAHRDPRKARSAVPPPAWRYRAGRGSGPVPAEPGGGTRARTAR